MRKNSIVQYFIMQSFICIMGVPASCCLRTYYSLSKDLSSSLGWSQMSLYPSLYYQHSLDISNSSFERTLINILCGMLNYLFQLSLFTTYCLVTTSTTIPCMYGSNQRHAGTSYILGVLYICTNLRLLNTCLRPKKGYKNGTIFVNNSCA